MRVLARSAMRASVRARSREPYEPNPRHVWIVRPDHLGDVLLVRPALKRIRAALPDWHITLVVGPWSRAVVEDENSVDEVITAPFPGFTRGNRVPPWEPYQELLSEAERLREIRPAAVVILRDDHWWAALMAQVAGAPVIIGADHPSMNGLLTDRISTRGQHWVARNIEMLDGAAQILGADVNPFVASPTTDPLIWNVTESDRAETSALLMSAGIEGPFAVIHPGSGAPVKLWPVDRWAQVADAFAASGTTVLLTGSEAEEPLLTQIRDVSNSNPTSLAGKTTIRTLAAIFEQAVIVAGVDSGPLHLAVAVGTPTRHIYGPSDVASYGPWGDPARHRVITAGLSCQRCGDLGLSRPEGAGCMVAVTTETILDSIQDLRLSHA